MRSIVVREHGHIVIISDAQWSGACLKFEEGTTPDRSEIMEELYHEQQSLALCAVHAVNNLLQTRRYTKRDFDAACVTLSPAVWCNPHRSILRIGDYDVNVVTILLQQEGFSVTWHDQRTALRAESLENLVGILWNVDAHSIWSRIFGGRHWIALLHRNEQWINLDSILAEPMVIGTHDDCVSLLNSKQDAHILLVTKEDSFRK
jgi:josephin